MREVAVGIRDGDGCGRRDFVAGEERATAPDAAVLAAAGFWTGLAILAAVGDDLEFVLEEIFLGEGEAFVAVEVLLSTRFLRENIASNLNSCS